MTQGTEKLFSSNYACPICGFSVPKLEPRLFSFNNPLGAYINDSKVSLVVYPGNKYQSQFKAQTEGNHSLAPVSYTHLDVYKRQIPHKIVVQILGRNTVKATHKPL